MIALGHLPNADQSFATAVSGDGSVIVGNSLISVPTRGFRWTADGGLMDLGELPGGSENNEPQDVSADGSVVVGWNVGPNAAFMWDAEHGMRSVSDVLTEAGVDLTGWTLSIATGASADGRVIVGYGQNPDIAGAFVGWRIEFVPEPTSCALCFIGCAGIEILRRRRILPRRSNAELA